jgi:hypothetical protein
MDPNTDEVIGTFNMKKPSKNRFISIAVLTIIVSMGMSGQDTVRYYGIVNNDLLYEKIELYPGGTFKWSSEYDLSWDEHGIYEFKNNLLELNFYLVMDYPKTMTLKDSIRHINSPKKTEILIAENDLLYRQSESGQKVTRIVDKSIKTHWSWINGHRHKYKIVKN